MIVLWRINWARFISALETINYPIFLLFTLLFNLALLSADSFATGHVYRTRICPVRFREIFVIRAASYLPSMINHHIGQGWLTYFLSKKYKAPLWRVTGATLLVYATTFACLILLVAMALPLNTTRAPWLGPTVLGAGVAGIAYLAIISFKPTRLVNWNATAPLVEAGLLGHLVAVTYRLPHMLVLFVGNLGLFRFFGLTIPLGDALAYIPAVMLVSALPLTPQGVGTRDLVAAQLLSGYAVGTPEEQTATVAAATLVWAASLTLIQGSISPWFMRYAQKLLANQKPNSENQI